jgi:guanine deaminase
MTNFSAFPELALDEAIRVAVENVANGGGPFGAVVIFPDGRIYYGVNRVTADNDPTAHAEVQAIRNACKAEGTFSLAGAVLYTSCEPCPMCLGAALWSRVDKIIFAADRYDAANAGFDDAEFYDVIESGEAAQPLATMKALDPFNAWNTKTDHTAY